MEAVTFFMGLAFGLVFGFGLGRSFRPRPCPCPKDRDGRSRLQDFWDEEDRWSN